MQRASRSSPAAIVRVASVSGECGVTARQACVADLSLICMTVISEAEAWANFVNSPKGTHA